MHDKDPYFINFLTNKRKNKIVSNDGTIAT